MLAVFEVYVDHLTDPDSILSAEIKSETQAQVMSAEDAREAGFSGFSEDPSKGVLRLIFVAEDDQRFVQSALERSAGVQSYDVHHVET